MTERLRLLGSQMSPYSIKVRSYLLYKGIEFDWIERSRKNEALFQQHARVQLIPLVLFPDGEAMQDSTPIIERLEAQYPEPAIHPADRATHFLSDLLEEFGDEWCNKLMFQFRWGPREDQLSAARRLSVLMLPGVPLKWIRPLFRPVLIRRMVPRMAFAGANDTNRPHLRRSWERTVALLDAHLEKRPYLFGGRPAFGDFGIWGNVAQAYSDPTGHGHISAHAPAVERWIDRMARPRAEGSFETLDELEPTLMPLLEEQVADRFLCWSSENARALEAGAPQTRLEFDGTPYEQKTFKYHAWSLERLKEKLPSRDAAPGLWDVLERSGCLPHLR